MKESDMNSQLHLAENSFEQAHTLEAADDQEKQFIRVREMLQAFTKKYPDNAQGFAQLAQVSGKLALFKGNREKIELGKDTKDAVDRALELNPKLGLGHAVLGVWNFELSRLSGIERFFGKILYGSIPKGDLDEALKHLQTAIALEPKTVFYRLALAKVLKSMDRKKDAEKQLKIALEIPDSVASDPATKKEIRELLGD